MKPFSHPGFRKPSRAGFGLVEASLSIGVMSFGFLSLAPLLALGLNEARGAHESRAAAAIAATLYEQAQQGTMASGALYFDFATNPCAPSDAAFAVRETVTSFAPGSDAAGPLSRLLITVTPVGSRAAPRIYADVFPTPPAP